MIDFIQIQNDIKETRSLLLSFISSHQHAAIAEESEQVFTVDECATFLHLSKATIYSKISKGELPTIKKEKRCYFLKSDLINYLKEDRLQTNREIQEEVSTILKEGE
jgi:excisionase family DNA binding protein|tara:strand:- start:269 stop:589 length:321 start_codon:yes stop_codon:yes gene_type:complete